MAIKFYDYSTSENQYFDSDTSSRTSFNTELSVGFSFKEEVAPKNRTEIRKRIKDGIKAYLVHGKERLIMSKSKDVYFRDPHIDSKQREVKVIEPLLPFSMSFDVTISSSKNLALEEMLDMHSLNHYILTGEYERAEKVNKKGELNIPGSGW